MKRRPILSAAGAAEWISDGAVVTVSSSAAQLVPESLLAALLARFPAQGAPRDLTVVLPLAVGDSFGTVGLDHLAHRGLIKRLVGGIAAKTPGTLGEKRVEPCSSS